MELAWSESVTKIQKPGHSWVFPHARLKAACAQKRMPRRLFTSPVQPFLSKCETLCGFGTRDFTTLRGHQLPRLLCMFSDWLLSAYNSSFESRPSGKDCRCLRALWAATSLLCRLLFCALASEGSAPCCRYRSRCSTEFMKWGGIRCLCRPDRRKVATLHKRLSIRDLACCTLFSSEVH
eukprot:s1321_g3.t1